MQDKVLSAAQAGTVVSSLEPVAPAQEVSASPPRTKSPEADQKAKRATRISALEPDPEHSGKKVTAPEPLLPVTEPKDKPAEQEAAATSTPVSANGSSLPGDPNYPVGLRQALADVIGARKQGKNAVFDEVFGIGHVRDCAEKAKLPYLDVCQKYLIDEGASAFSDSRVTTLVQVYDYLTTKGFKAVADLPTDLNCFPAYSQILPLYKFVRHPRVAQAHKAEWDELHGRVFDPANRPTVEAIEKAVGEIFAPPKKKHNKNKAAVVTQTVIKPEDVSDWYGQIAPNGKLAIAEITVAKMTASALATAMESDWKNIKSAQLLRVKVSGKGETK